MQSFTLKLMRVAKVLQNAHSFTHADLIIDAAGELQKLHALRVQMHNLVKTHGVVECTDAEGNPMKLCIVDPTMLEHINNNETLRDYIIED